MVHGWPHISHSRTEMACVRAGKEKLGEGAVMLYQARAHKKISIAVLKERAGSFRNKEERAIEIVDVGLRKNEQNREG